MEQGAARMNQGDIALLISLGIIAFGGLCVFCYSIGKAVGERDVYREQIRKMEAKDRP